MSIQVEVSDELFAFLSDEGERRGLTPEEYGAAILMRDLLEEYDDGPQKSREELSRAWLLCHGSEFFRGRWVALHSAELLAAAPTLKELHQRVERHPETMIVRVPMAGFNRSPENDTPAELQAPLAAADELTALSQEIKLY